MDKPPNVPTLMNPSLWYDEMNNLLYTGFSGWNSSFGDKPNMPPLSLWSFKPDGTGDGFWNETIGSDSPIWKSLTRTSTALMAQSQDVAIVLGGTTEPHTYPSTTNLLRGMVQFDMKSQSFIDPSVLNTTIGCCNATAGIERGGLHYVPSFGPQGIFIAMGGQNGSPTPTGFASLIHFGTVSIFDPAKQEWLNQTTSGSKPSPRIEYCVAGIDSLNGTHEMLDSISSDLDDG